MAEFFFFFLGDCAGNLVKIVSFAGLMLKDAILIMPIKPIYFIGIVGDYGGKFAKIVTFGD